MRRFFAIALAAVLISSFACSNDSDADKPAITVGSANFTESKILAEIYAQHLEMKGFDVTKKLNIGAREAYFPALKSGAISLFPEYTGSALNYLTKQTDAAKPDAQETYSLLTAELKKINLTALSMASAQDQDGIVTNKETAAKFSLKKVSDLKAHGAELVMGGPPECKTRIACLKGLQDIYGIHFKEFKSLDAGGPQTIRALASDGIQVANLFTTDARITDQGFVLLTHDKPVVGAENVVPIVRGDVLEAYADDDLAGAVNEVTGKLTTAGLTELNKKVDIDKDDPEAVAADWLDQQGLGA